MVKPAVVAIAILAVASSALAQRLPAGVVPIHYDISVAPDLAAAAFTGDVTIRVSLSKPSSRIVLNAAEITFKDVRITAGGITQTATVTLDAKNEQAVFSVPRAVPAGEAQIAIRYDGILNDDLRGLYLSKANNRRYAVTQLEATDARRMFPSFDEPAFKATYALSATIDAGDHAISNGAVVSDTPGPGAGKHTLRFETTPKMSTYLVALAVGDFECRGGTADGIPVRICATPDKKALTGFALEATQAIVQYFNDYYTITYPFKKLDIVAVPDFAAGAMENTAAIFYREALLLADDNASLPVRKSIAEVLAHEIAHQWFGNLVTMQWWDDIWLNEGFANWAMSKPLKAWRPDWHVELDEIEDNHVAMGLDSLRSTRPGPRQGHDDRRNRRAVRPDRLRKGGGGAADDRGVGRRGAVPEGGQRLHRAVPVRQCPRGRLLEDAGPLDREAGGRSDADLRGPAGAPAGVDRPPLLGSRAPRRRVAGSLPA